MVPGAPWARRALAQEPVRRLHKPQRLPSGLTLTEVLVVLGIFLILASMAYPVLTSVRDRGRLVQCLGNLRGIMAALQLYEQEHLVYPAQNDDLSARLAQHVDNPGVFKCPEDEEQGADSYSGCYISRRNDDPIDSLVLACPRHFGFRKSLNLALDASQSVDELLVIHRKTVLGLEEIPAGELVTDGDVQFGEAVLVEATSGNPGLRPITAFKRDDGGVHVVVGITQGSTGQVRLTRGAKALVELVTHAGVIAAKESNVSLWVTKQSLGGHEVYSTEVTSNGDSVIVTPTTGSYLSSLPGGFALSKQNDSAYEPVSVPSGGTAIVTREE